MSNYAKKSGIMKSLENTAETINFADNVRVFIGACQSQES